jgi:microcystin-dependent protein
VIGTTYGVGDGSTTFNVPDLRGRVAIGKNAATFSALGATGGAETHAITVAEMPSHNHGGSTATETTEHTHNVTISGSAGGTAQAAPGSRRRLGGRGN